LGIVEAKASIQCSVFRVQSSESGNGSGVRAKLLGFTRVWSSLLGFGLDGAGTGSLNARGLSGGWGGEYHNVLLYIQGTSGAEFAVGAGKDTNSVPEWPSRICTKGRFIFIFYYVMP
jgi:hypothetical protein